MRYEMDDRIDRNRKRSRRTTRIWVTLGCGLVVALVVAITACICIYVGEKIEGDVKDATEVMGIIGGADGPTSIIIGETVGGQDKPVIEDEMVPVAQMDLKIAEAKTQVREETIKAVQDHLRGRIQEGDSLVQAIRSLYPDELVVYSAGDYHFVPINHELKKNSLKQENVQVLESGEFQYVEDGQVTSYKGIDVSQHQGKIDWKKVAQDGVQYAIIRVGYRGYGEEGKLVEDTQYKKNIEGALAAGIRVGAYFYSQATSEAEAKEEAEFVLERIKKYKITCPVVVDSELVDGAEGRMDSISAQERAQYAAVFCDRVEQAGYKSMIYHNLEVGVVKMEPPMLEKYDRWFASYSETLYYPYEYKMWQYTDKGKVSGIKGNVDLNISFEPIWE
ncbi:MAG: glycoside hydrolase family 25 protein [Lachnospiraceae bacterium]|nr:glycoside hydrolase family 25 protein [Lachnospiraceae bacterium]